MTTAVKEKKPFLPQRKPQVHAGDSVTLHGSAGSRPALSSAALTIGGEPRVHLLPLETQERKKLRQLKRRLFGVGIAVVVIVAAAYGLATLELTASQTQLSAAQAVTTQLLVQQSKYGAVTKVQTDVAAILAAQKTTTAQEILWAPFLDQVESTLPGGATVTAVTASLDTPFGQVAPPSTGSVPLQGPRISTVQLTVSIPQGDIPGWLNRLPTVTGFVDDTPGSVAAPSDGSGNYLVVVTVHLNSLAVSNRFTKAGTN